LFLLLYLSNCREEHEKKVKDRLMCKVKESIIEKKALYCIGYHLPAITIQGIFTKPLYFSNANFHGEANTV
jgi:hypothetical protein